MKRNFLRNKSSSTSAGHGNCRVVQAHAVPIATPNHGERPSNSAYSHHASAKEKDATLLHAARIISLPVSRRTLQEGGERRSRHHSSLKARASTKEITAQQRDFDQSVKSPSLLTSNLAPRRHKQKRGSTASLLASLPPCSHQVIISDSEYPTSPRTPHSTSPVNGPVTAQTTGSSRMPSLSTAMLLLTLTLLVSNIPALITSHLRVTPQTAPPALPFTSWRTPGQRRSTHLPTVGSGPQPHPDVLPPKFRSSKVRVAAVVAGDAPSPMMATPWGEVMNNLGQRLEWTDQEYAMQVIYSSDLEQPGQGRDAALAVLDAAQVVIGEGVRNPGVVGFLEQELLGSKVARAGQTVFFLNSAGALDKVRRLGGREWVEGGVSSPLQQLLPWNWDSGRRAEVVTTVKELWSRGDSENLLFAVLVLVNEYVSPVPAVKSSAKGMDLQSLACIVRHCFSQVKGCINNPTCKTALDCLNNCSFNDQVCQYRCIVSHETPELGEFSLCILQLHNCRRLTATLPPLPDPSPLASFQGAPMTHEVAEKVLRGWLGSSHTSWMVAAGKNPAYDYFPCQHQLFFPGRAKGAHWYEPVFKVKTLDGGEVWRRRRYRVRRGKLPGTFHFTVLDNGVTSNEFWRLLDAADDLSFSLFYYSGAASAAGLSYTGAILATPDGAPPAAEQLPRIQAALERAGVKMWELTSVDNSQCVGAPVELSQEAQAMMAAIAAA